MKTCLKCNEAKPLSEFYARSKGGSLRGQCKTCWKAYMRPRSKHHYDQNKDYYRRRNKRSKTELKTLLRSLKEGKPCADCGVVYPFYVMDFDHNGSEKAFNVGRGINRSEKALLAEIAKCDLVCANCHRIRTFKHLDTGGKGGTRTRDRHEIITLAALIH